MPSATLHPADSRYIERHAAYYDKDLDDLDSLSDAWRIYIDEKLGHVTHRSRCRIKSTAYDWQKLNAWMTECGMANESLALLYRIQYHRPISVGTIANIRCGSYTNSDTVKRVMAIMEEANG